MAECGIESLSQNQILEKSQKSKQPYPRNLIKENTASTYASHNNKDKEERKGKREFDSDK